MAARRKAPEIKTLYYITHVKNLDSILRHGILSHSEVAKRGFTPETVYDEDIISRRQEIGTPAGDSLWEYANVYFNPRNPMLYRLTCTGSVTDLAVLAVRADILNIPGVFVTDGNAANGPTTIYPKNEGLDAVKAGWSVIENEYWNQYDGSKRRIMAEVLVPRMIPPQHIQTIYVASQKVREELGGRLLGVDVVPEPKLFFRPGKQVRVTSNLSLADGDMFFSKAQTLTISVNIKGIMGKGLASRAKYQFPDVYVAYQDACRSRKVAMGKPYLFKREESFAELADELSDGNDTDRWFLLFATKSHWRENSDLPGIEKGLEWVLKNYKKQGIRSLAMPALGCGLGNLEWRDVGPVMCKYLSQMDITTTIYLPRESQLSEETLSREFLLKS